MWNWLKVVGRALAQYAPAVVTAILEARAKKAAEKPDEPKG